MIHGVMDVPHYRQWFPSSLSVGLVGVLALAVLALSSKDNPYLTFTVLRFTTIVFVGAGLYSLLGALVELRDVQRRDGPKSPSVSSWIAIGLGLTILTGAGVLYRLASTFFWGTLGD